MKIYLALPKDKRFKDIEELITYGYSNPANRYAHGFMETYFDRACTREQCHCARRSFEELLDICRTYFPRTGKKQLALILYKMFNRQQTGQTKLFPFYCGNIQKVVFSAAKIPNLTYNTSWLLNESVKSFDYSFNRAKNLYSSPPNHKGKGKFTFNQILELLNMPPLPGPPNLRT